MFEINGVSLLKNMAAQNIVMGGGKNTEQLSGTLSMAVLHLPFLMLMLIIILWITCKQTWKQKVLTV